MLLPLRNLRQRQQADCLVACAAMVLDYLGIAPTYEWLLRLLGTAEPGTPFSNLERLRTLKLFVRCELYGTLTLIEETSRPWFVSDRCGRDMGFAALEER